MSQFETPLAGYRQVKLIRGDSLQRLAARELGDAARWVDIANLNGLTPPYVTDDPLLSSARVALTGSALWVLSSTPVVPFIASPELLYDQDVLLTNGKLTSNGGDFNLAYGEQNLKQAINNRLVTEKSELLFHPDYGCDINRQLGGMQGPVADQLAASYVASAMRSDPRISDVPSCTATVTLDTMSVVATVIPINGQQIQFLGVL